MLSMIYYRENEWGILINDKYETVRKGRPLWRRPFVRCRVALHAVYDSLPQEASLLWPPLVFAAFLCALLGEQTQCGFLFLSDFSGRKNYSSVVRTVVRR